MSLLPTAHAGQSFGARRIDFYTVSGEVSASDDTTGRVIDTDSMTHDVRLLDRSNALAPGDTASVLRVQAGPNRRSRPAAIINHSRGTWMRAAPEATTLLARSGVTRSFNWWLSVLFLAFLALAAVWPAIHGFLTEVNASLMAQVPAFDVFAEINALLPALGGWRMETALPAGLIDSLASLGFVPMDQLTEWSLALGAGLITLLAFFGRSWRLIYIPALGALALAAGAILGSALPTLAVVGGSLAFFTLAGLVNRIRDGGRLNARIARLAEHALRNPPQEGVRASNTGHPAAAGIAASAAIAAATATAEGEHAEAGPAGTVDVAPETDTDVSAETGDQPANDASADDHASGEVAAPDQSDLLPAASGGDAEIESEAATQAEAAAPEASGDAVGTPEAGESAPSADPIDEMPESGAETSDDTAAVMAVGADAELDSDAGIAAEPASKEVADPAPETRVDSGDSTDMNAAETPLDPAPEEPAAPEAVAVAVAEPESAETDSAEPESTETDSSGSDSAEPKSAETESSGTDDLGLDDDLPSLDEVAAAAALNETETNLVDGPSGTTGVAPLVAVDLDDERTMPVAPPPPMPGNDAPATAVQEPEATQTPEPVAETPPAEPDAAADLQPDDAAAEMPVSEAAPEPEAEPAPRAGIDAAPPIVDDPMMEEAADPMVPRAEASDFAPGAPDIEMDRSPAE